MRAGLTFGTIIRYLLPYLLPAGSLYSLPFS